jgi:hypothetical protein
MLQPYYPAICTFPGCDHAAPLSPDDDPDGALCDEHDRLRFYQHDTFLRLWQERDPER